MSQGGLAGRMGLLAEAGRDEQARTQAGEQLFPIWRFVTQITLLQF